MRPSPPQPKLHVLTALSMPLLTCFTLFTSVSSSFRPCSERRPALQGTVVGVWVRQEGVSTAAAVQPAGPRCLQACQSALLHTQQPCLRPAGRLTAATKCNRGRGRRHTGGTEAWTGSGKASNPRTRGVRGGNVDDKVIRKLRQLGHAGAVVCTHSGGEAACIHVRLAQPHAPATNQALQADTSACAAHKRAHAIAPPISTAHLLLRPRWFCSCLGSRPVGRQGSCQGLPLPASAGTPPGGRAPHQRPHY